MDKPNSIIIFSKDRAAQLDLCMKSMHKNMQPLLEKSKVYIIYTSSSKDFESGYTKLGKEWGGKPAIYFLPEKKYGGFKKTLEYCLTHECASVICFTDDDISYRKLEEKELDRALIEVEHKDTVCISFRLGVNTFIQDQYTNGQCLVPDEVIQGPEVIRSWDWKKLPYNHNFSYPFALDGHMFKKEFFIWVSSKSGEYDNPNSLEGTAHHRVISAMKSNIPPKMKCFENGVIVNTPINRVQETCHNQAGKFFGLSAEDLNNRFLKGDRLTLDGMDFTTIIGVHQELKMCWEQNV